MCFQRSFFERKSQPLRVQMKTKRAALVQEDVAEDGHMDNHLCNSLNNSDSFEEDGDTNTDLNHKRGFNSHLIP